MGNQALFCASEPPSTSAEAAPRPEANSGEAVTTGFRRLDIDDVKALKKPPTYKKYQTFKEIKHGSVTIYQETYQLQFRPEDKPGNVVEGEAFYLAEGKYLVGSSKVEALKKVIDRNKAPKLSQAMQAGLKDASFSNTVLVVVDLENMPAE